jgi:hypothetical protein
MLKLRDRVVLETSIRDAKGEFDAPFGYAEGFDETTGEYAGLIYAKAARKSSPRRGSLFAPTLRSSKCRACRPLRPVRSPEGTAPRVRRDLLPARQALAYCFREPCAKSSCVFRALKAHNDRGHHTD